MKPNSEQEAVIDAFLSESRSIAINALAGTGKTTTLKMAAAAAPSKRIQYIAFNRAIADDAKSKMPQNTEVSTMHSLAYRAMKPDRSRLELRLNGGFIAQQFSVRKSRANTGIGVIDISPALIGSMALETVSRFCNSNGSALSLSHVPSWSRVFEVVPADIDRDEALKDVVFQLALKVWSAMRDRNSQFPITHDTYLKLWALASGQINTDVVFFDEAQDASGVFLQVLNNQIDRRIVFVGDQNQQIYAWRGAIDALQRIRADQRFYLTRSYRFGPKIAGQANRMLRCLGESHLLIGEGGGGYTDDSRAVLCRTNAVAITHFCETPDAELVGSKEFLSLVRSLGNLMAGRGSAGAFALFPSYTSLIEYTQTQDGGDLKPLIDLVERRGIDDVLCRLEQSSTRSSARGGVVISTVHKAKGREWDSVRIEDDWRNPKKVARADEMRLMYVALTRGRCSVDASAVAGFLSACEEIESQKMDLLEPGVADDVSDTPTSEVQGIIEQAKRRAAQTDLATPKPARKARKGRKRVEL